MAESTKLPRSINTEERDLSTVVITLEIPGLKVEKKFFGAAKPKSKECEADVKFEPLGFEVTAKIMSGGNVTNYNYKVNQLPGELDLSKCKEEYKKDMIILTLGKKEESTWVVFIKNGLDQAPSE